jgi:hypothetical protein
VPQALAVAYTPSTATTGNVVVMLFVDKQVIPIDGRNGGTGMFFTKTFATNTTEVVQFTDFAGNMGYTGVSIDWIAYPEQNYGYNGDYQTFIAPQDGDYVIELRGAGGRFNGNNNGSQGKGAYTKGAIALKAGDVLYLYP